LVVIAMAGFLVLSGCSEDKATRPVLSNQYAGSAACATCHGNLTDATAGSGHARVLNPVVDGKRPDDPRLTLPDNPPGNLAWDDIAFVLGGFGWKVRFITGTEGNYEIVTGEAAQWNIPTQEWVAYNAGQPTPYDYSCFRCHTTGPAEDTDTFFASNVTCEACHGEGNLHILDAAANLDDPDLSLISADPRAEMCGECHNRGGLDAPAPARNGFIRHHEQYNEMVSGGHRFLECVTCHDPHIGVRGDQMGGLVRVCTDCHLNVQTNHFSFGGRPDCVDCHMPFATRSAVAFTPYRGDVRTHVFEIHVGEETKDAMFENDALKRDFGVTLDFVCYQCHRDSAGVGGSGSQRSLAELAEASAGMHGGSTQLSMTRR
jgi:hypothetical protein